MSNRPLLEIVPGQGLGPFRLGMTLAQMSAACWQLGLPNDGAPNGSGLAVELDAEQRVVAIEIRAHEGPARLSIFGEPIDDIRDEPVRALLARHTALPSDWTSLVELGLCVLHWERSDGFVFSFRVHPPGEPARRGELLGARPPQALLDACRAARDVWERSATHLSMMYEDSVVGLSHRIDPSLPRRSVDAITSGRAVSKRLQDEWLEPITAIDDGDWELPAHARLAFHACYNGLRAAAGLDGARMATALEQARRARESEPRLDEPPRPEE